MNMKEKKGKKDNPVLFDRNLNAALSDVLNPIKYIYTLFKYITADIMITNFRVGLLYGAECNLLVLSLFIALLISPFNDTLIYLGMAFLDFTIL